MRISKNTAIPLYFLPFLIGGVFWLGQLETKVSEMCEDLKVITKDVKEIGAENTKAQKNLAKIETALTFIKANVQNRRFK